jgi:CheY-like chemotaxis protein
MAGWWLRLKFIQKINLMSILYIDDDIEDIEIFNEAVRAVDPSIQYLSATSGKDALEILNSSHTLPNHILLDINMPGMDGKSWLKEIRSERRFDPINVIIYSTNSFPQDIEDIEAMGASFMRKANSFNDLCEMIRKLIANEGRTTAG